MEGNKCAVCAEDVDDVYSRKTRKRLYGANCNVQLYCLKTIVTSSAPPKFNTLTAFKLNNHEAWLCMKCQRLLLKFKRLKEELTQITADVNQKLDSLCMLGRPPPGNARKRVVREDSTSENNEHAQVMYAKPTILNNNNNHPHTSRDLKRAATSPEVSVSI